ncbi:MAG: metal ABC transporter substrate-binding protein [Eubacterium sp.]|jgi:zinc transport system substrate-binding protein|nr:metal ABC transporter substrate-binding protein [Eubacterium sp.]
MKRLITITAAFVFLTTALFGCVQETAVLSSEVITEKEIPVEDENPSDTEKIKIVCTVFPQYDWVRQILGERADDAELTLLVNNGIDLHSFQPAVDDIVKISECDLFIHVGGESDEWVDDALKEATNPDMVVISLLEAAGDKAKLEEIREGMEDDEHDHSHEGDQEDHDEEHEEGGEHEDEEVFDEHVWMSLRNAQALCSVIADKLSEFDPANADEYKNNLFDYNEKLNVLDMSYIEAVSAAPIRTLLFGDRFPFRYLVDDYDLDYYAAFPGCSAETEASFDTIIFLAGKMDELSLKNIMVTESANKSIAQTIIDSTAEKDQQILVLDAMQSVTSEDVASGATYISIVESNLNILKNALK